MIKKVKIESNSIIKTLQLEVISTGVIFEKDYEVGSMPIKFILAHGKCELSESIRDNTRVVDVIEHLVKWNRVVTDNFIISIF